MDKNIYTNKISASLANGDVQSAISLILAYGQGMDYSISFTRDNGNVILIFQYPDGTSFKETIKSESIEDMLMKIATVLDMMYERDTGKNDKYTIKVVIEAIEQAKVRTQSESIKDKYPPQKKDHSLLYGLGLLALYLYTRKRR